MLLLKGESKLGPYPNLPILGYLDVSQLMFESILLNKTHLVVNEWLLNVKGAFLFNTH